MASSIWSPPTLSLRSDGPAPVAALLTAPRRADGHGVADRTQQRGEDSADAAERGLRSGGGGSSASSGS